MALDAAIARRRLAQVRRGVPTRDIEQLGIKNPQGMLNALAPGFRMFEASDGRL
jgi:hypothetical protein